MSPPLYLLGSSAPIQRAVLVHIHFGLDQWSVIAHRCRCHRLWEFCDIEKEHWDIVTLRSWARLWTTLGLGGGFWRTISRASNPNQQSSQIESLQTRILLLWSTFMNSRGTRLGWSTNIETFEMSSFNDNYIAHIICLTDGGAVHFRVFCHHNFSLTSPL